jgi:hypothetical protein
MKKPYNKPESELTEMKTGNTLPMTENAMNLYKVHNYVLRNSQLSDSQKDEMINLAETFYDEYFAGKIPFDMFCFFLAVLLMKVRMNVDKKEFKKVLDYYYERIN